MSEQQPFALKCDTCGKVLGTCDRLTMGGHLCGSCGEADNQARGIKQKTEQEERAKLKASLAKTSGLSEAAIERWLK